MRTAIALNGVLLLSAVLLLPACRSNGAPRPAVATEVVVVEVPRRQLVRVSEELTAVSPLPPEPSPAIPAGPGCDRPAGCFSGRQLETMLGIALADRSRLVENLGAIRRLMSEALTKGNPDEAYPAAVPGRGVERQDPR